ncbi:MAG: hypothetical protein K8F24_05920, partial [Bacteroidales bacterium]|nr:hypothetical protein [Bacteroidales bacterium]
MKTHLLRSILVLFISVNMFSNLNEVKGAAGWYADYIIVAVNGSGSAYYWIGADPTFGTQLQDHDFGTVSSLVITGVDMKYWGDNGDRTGGAFYYKIMSSDGNTVIVGDTEVLWDQAFLGGNDFQGTKTLDINVLNSLVAATEYKLHIWAKSWGTSEGDSWLSNNGANYVASFRVENPTEWNGTKDHRR